MTPSTSAVIDGVGSGGRAADGADGTRTDNGDGDGGGGGGDPVRAVSPELLASDSVEPAERCPVGQVPSPAAAPAAGLASNDGSKAGLPTTASPSRRGGDDAVAATPTVLAASASVEPEPVVLYDTSVLVVNADCLTVAFALEDVGMR